MCVVKVNSSNLDSGLQSKEVALVVIDLTFLWCEQHKKLISRETVTATKKKTRGVKGFDKHDIKVFTNDSGWLRNEPEHWI